MPVLVAIPLGVTCSIIWTPLEATPMLALSIFTLACQRWCLPVLMSLLVYLEFRIFVNKTEDLADLVPPMVVLGLFIFAFFRYLAGGPLVVQAELTSSFHRLVPTISKHASRASTQHGKAIQRRCRRARHTRVRQTTVRLQRTRRHVRPNWSRILAKFQDCLLDARRSWQGFSLAFHTIVLGSIFYVALALFNIAREFNKLDDAVHALSPGDNIYDVLIRHKAERHFFEEALENHLATAGLMMLNTLYAMCGIAMLFQTLWLVGALNSTTPVKKAAEDYLASTRGRVNQDFFNFWNTIQGLSGTSSVARLLMISVTREKVMAWMGLYVVKLPVCLLLLHHITHQHH